MNVKIARIKKGIKQQDFAKMLGVSRAILVKIEKGDHDIRLSLMKKISEILETPVQELFFNE